MKSQPKSISRRDVLRGAAAWAVASAGGWSLSFADETNGAGIDSIKEKLPRTARMIEQIAGRAGGQLYISQNGKIVADVAWGTQSNGQPYTPVMLVPWASAVKPTTCVCLMKLWEKGKLDLDDPVVKFIPEFAAHGKENVRVRHLLTHTGHLGGYAGPLNLSPKFEDTVNKIIQAPRRAGRRSGSATPPPVGTSPAYDPAGIWIIAEICRRLDGRDFKDIIRKEVYEPCGMLDSWCGIPPEKYREYRAKERIPETGRGGYLLSSEDQAGICQPAGGGAGPSRELARFYEMMLGRGTINGNRILSPQTVEAMTTPHSSQGLMGVWGLGFILAYGKSESSDQEDGPETTDDENASPRRRGAGDRFGPHASFRAFGHPGASGMQAFADPEYGLAVAFIGRIRLQAAIYEDLGLAQSS